MTDASRRYDIDWLRVIAIGLLIIYHIGIAFQPWGIFIGFIQNEESISSIWPGMSLLNIWRIPLLFFVSGMGVSFSMRKRNWKQLLGERFKRILIPLVFGSLLIVPLHVLVWQKYYDQDISYAPSTGHLWFLANILIYVLLLSPLFYLLKNNENGRFQVFIRKTFSHPIGLILIIACFTIEAIMLNPESFETYYNSWHGFLLGFLAFLFGFIMVYSGNRFWEMIAKWKWVSLVLALSLYLVRLLVFDLNPPLYLYPIESNAWIFTLFGFAYRVLNKPGKILSYLNQAAYPIYILHMIFIYIGSYLIFPLELNVWVKFISLIIFTFLGSFASYELIKRIGLIRQLFGLRKTSIKN